METATHLMEIYRAVREEVRASGRAEIPAWLLGEAQEEDILRMFHRRWYALYAVHLEQQEDAELAWRRAAGAAPEIRAVLDAYEGHPALAYAVQPGPAVVPQPRPDGDTRRCPISRAFMDLLRR